MLHVNNSPPYIFDQMRRLMQRNKISPQYNNLLYKQIADEILERLYDFKRQYNNVFIYGATPYLASLITPYILKVNFAAEITWADFAPNWLKCLPNYHQNDAKFIIMDEENHLPLTEKYDLVISCMTMHNLNDPIAALVQYKNLLKPEGLFLACQFGGKTLSELRHSLYEAQMLETNGAGAHIHPFADVKNIGALAQRAGFNFPISDSLNYQMSCKNIIDLAHFLRKIGETNILTSKTTSINKAVLSKANQLYKQYYSLTTDKLLASFEIIFITAI